MCWTALPLPRCHCWEEMGFLPMLARALGSIRSVSKHLEQWPCCLEHGSVRSMAKWQRRKDAGAGVGRNVWLESGLSQRNPQSEGGVEPAAGGPSSSLVLLTVRFHDTQSQGGCKPGRLSRNGLSFTGTTVANAMCRTSFSPGFSCLFFA